ncbi:iron-compound ABC transporter permease [Streptococcus pneumoniae]|nr:iron-compound ABC transporter permease [Streptococcus pneumoniae]
MLPLIGIIYSGIIGSVTEVIAYRFNLVQSMTAWTQGSFSMIQTHQYEWLFLGLIILITVWKLSQSPNLHHHESRERNQREFGDFLLPT